MPRMVSASYQRYSASEAGTEGRGDTGTLFGSRVCSAGRLNKSMPATASTTILIGNSLSKRRTLIKRERLVGFCAFLWSIALDGQSCERVDRGYGHKPRPARLLRRWLCIYTGTPTPTKLESPQLRPQNREAY